MSEIAVGEVVNVIVAVAFIALVVSWATSPKETPEQKTIRTTLGFKPKHITSEMLDTVSSMFPDIPKDNIRYDLMKTGNVEMTTNKIIERGFLQAPPPAYYRLFPLGNATLAAVPVAATDDAASTSTVVTGIAQTQSPSLIERYQLQSRLPDASNAEFVAGSSKDVLNPEDAGGKAAWEATSSAREASLRERKAQMILAARRRLMEQGKEVSS